MLKKIFWLSIANIKRRSIISILFFILSLVVSAQLFLIMLTSFFLTLPQSTGVKGFFYTTGLTSIVLVIIIIPAVSILYSKSRYQDYLVYKIFGEKKIDIVFLFLFEIFILSILGSILGGLIILLFISFNIIYLPGFLQNVKHVWSLKLISIMIKSIFGVSLTIVVTSLIVLLFKFNDKNIALTGFGE